MKETLKRLFSQRSFIASTVMIGLIVVLAIYSLNYSNYDLQSTKYYYTAAPFSVPSWATIFPQYRSLPPNENLTLNLITSIPKYNSTVYELTVPAGGIECVNFTLNWPYQTPYSESISFYIFPKVSSDQLFFVNLTWITPDGNKELLLSNVPSTQEFSIFATYVNFININEWNEISFNTANAESTPSPFVSNVKEVEELVFLNYLVMPKPGNYHLSLIFVNNSTKPETFLFTLPKFSDKGRAYGLLGTDNNGVPIFPAFAIGARFELIIALVASLLIVLIGSTLGIIGGYFGRRVDAGIIWFTDFFLLLPAIPLLAILEAILFQFKVNISRLDLITLLISIISWPATARIVRSQTLSLRSRTFVEAAKVLGLSNTQIIVKHVLPSLIPIIAAQIAYDVPIVIGIESSLDYLGLGITSYPTWGGLIASAQDMISSANQFAWWWVLPPGIGIVLLSAGFFYLGNAIIKTFSIVKG